MRHEEPARQRATPRQRATGNRKQRASARERARPVSRTSSRIPPAASELESPSPPAGQSSQIDEVSRFVGELLAIVDGTAISELEVDWDGRSVHIRREPSRETARVEQQQSKEARPAEDRVVVTSTSVGVFHRDGAAGFPEPGQVVAAGAPVAEVQTLGIRSPVVAPVDGTLAAVLVDDGTPVEYGQPLLVIDPTPGIEA